MIDIYIVPPIEGQQRKGGKKDLHLHRKKKKTGVEISAIFNASVKKCSNNTFTFVFSRLRKPDLNGCENRAAVNVCGETVPTPDFTNYFRMP